MLSVCSLVRKSALCGRGRVPSSSSTTTTSRSAVIAAFRTFSTNPVDVVDTAPTTVEEPKKKQDILLRTSLRPADIVEELNRHIVGQNDAKRAVAIAMRNRWRRRQLPKEMMKEVTPRNVLMIGPTGCGKVTEKKTLTNSFMIHFTIPTTIHYTHCFVLFCFCYSTHSTIGCFSLSLSILKLVD